MTAVHISKRINIYCHHALISQHIIQHVICSKVLNFEKFVKLMIAVQPN